MGSMDSFLFLKKPRYYDAPDGEKPIDKIVATSKKGFLTALFLGLNDCVWITETTGPLETVNCMAYYIVPIVSMSATFAAVTYMSTKIRGKDDKVNYAIGAAACSPILHAWKKSTPYTLYGTAIMMAIAVGAKHKAQHGWEVFPEPKHIYGNYMYDFSLVKERDKNFRSPYF